MQYIYGPNNLSEPVVSWNGDITEAFVKSDGVYVVLGYNLEPDNNFSVTLLYTGKAKNVIINENCIALPVPNYLSFSYNVNNYMSINYMSIWCLPDIALVEPLLKTQIESLTKERKPWFAPAGQDMSVKFIKHLL